jgi:hypothetical protein
MPEKGAVMFFWLIFKEDEDTGRRTLLGDIQADTQAQALELAAQYFEIDMGELIAVRR